MAHCIFCEIVAGRSEATFLYRDYDVAAFLDIQPINPGHMLVIPVVHASGLRDLDPQVGGRAFKVAQQMAAALYDSQLKCEGVNVFLADGKAAMQDVFHAHFHVIPRFKGDGFGLKLPEHYFEKPGRTELERVAAAIRKGQT